jgi:hypothetical protein
MPVRAQRPIIVKVMPAILSVDPVLTEGSYAELRREEIVLGDVVNRRGIEAGDHHSIREDAGQKGQKPGCPMLIPPRVNGTRLARRTLGRDGAQ